MRAGAAAGSGSGAGVEGVGADGAAGGERRFLEVIFFLGDAFFLADFAGFFLGAGFLTGFFARAIQHSSEKGHRRKNLHLTN